MNPKTFLKLGAAICGLTVSTTLAFSQGTAFTYQGRLNSGGSPVTGLYDFTNALYNALSGGAQAGPTLTNLAVPVTNGLFSVPLDFGAVFNGTAYWLQIGVRSNGAGGYTPLSPRQELTPTPYAITAENLDGLLPAGQLSGTLGLGLFPLPLDLSGSTVPPLFEIDQNGSGTGISGVHTSAAGMSPCVEGSTVSRDDGAAGVYGLVSATSPGGFSAAVRGENKGTGGLGIGVYGSQAGSGWGGWFTSISGVGVWADGGAGTGVHAIGATGVYTFGSGSALTIGGGAIHVSGAGIGTGTAAFIHRATAANTSFDSTIIDNAQCNGDPNAILIITQNYNPGGGSGTYNTHHVGVYYIGPNWAIFNEDQAPMVQGSAYNVLVIKN